MKESIQDNDNYKPHVKHYSNPSMFTQIIVQTRKCDGRMDGRTAAITISLTAIHLIHLSMQTIDRVKL